MYVYYWKSVITGKCTVEVLDYEMKVGYYPSECQWIIPGTVDPRDD